MRVRQGPDDIWTACMAIEAQWYSCRAVRLVINHRLYGRQQKAERQQCDTKHAECISCIRGIPIRLRRRFYSVKVQLADIYRREVGASAANCARRCGPRAVPRAWGFWDCKQNTVRRRCEPCMYIRRCGIVHLRSGTRSPRRISDVCKKHRSASRFKGEGE